MKQLSDFKNELHKCSKCGLCQAECPIYKITGNDCTVSRGQFNMLKGVLNGDLKMSNPINRYLDLCLKCNSCSKFCPSGINVTDIIFTAKSEYFKKHFSEKIKVWGLKIFIFNILFNFLSIFKQKTKSKQYTKKVLFFGGCGSKVSGDKAVVKILNSLNIEVINPSFNCCGIPYLTRGDLKSFNNSIKNYIKILKKYNINEVVTTCASCEKTLKDYQKWSDDSDKEFLKNLCIKNVYEYIKENRLILKLKEPVTVTYHKPCNICNAESIDWVLNNTENLNYIKMSNFDKCCGLNILTKIKEYKVGKEILKNKRKSILNSGCKQVLTSCLGCEIALKTYSLGQYKTDDLLNFIAKNL